jgi:hypothetical protein
MVSRAIASYSRFHAKAGTSAFEHSVWSARPRFDRGVATHRDDPKLPVMRVDV